MCKPENPCKTSLPSQLAQNTDTFHQHLQALISLMKLSWPVAVEAAFALAELVSQPAVRAELLDHPGCVFQLAEILQGGWCGVNEDRLWAGVMLCVLQLCRDSPDNTAAFIAEDEVQGDAGSAYGFAFLALLTSQSVAARCLPALLAGELFGGQSKAAQHWAAWLVAELTELEGLGDVLEGDLKRQIAAEFLPLVARFLDHKESRDISQVECCPDTVLACKHPWKLLCMQISPFELEIYCKDQNSYVHPPAEPPPKVTISQESHAR